MVVAKAASALNFYTVRRKLLTLSFPATPCILKPSKISLAQWSVTPMDWKSIFLPDISIFEIILRGSVMYIALFALLRIILKRQTGALGMTDLLLITLLADASQNAMAGEHKSIPDGIVLVGTIIFWDYALDWLSFKAPWFERLIEPSPLPLVKQGKLLR